MGSKKQLKFNNNKLNNLVSNRLQKFSLKVVLFPFIVLLIIFLILFFNGEISSQNYIAVQKSLFLKINAKLSGLHSLQHNITQLGDVTVLLPLFSSLLIFAPRFWHVLLNSLCLSLFVSFFLKRIFSVPRPAAALYDETFLVIGDGLFGNTSLPSGHAIATFTVITLLWISFNPSKLVLKTAWFKSLFLIACLIVITRIGVGAHYPLDVMIGGAIGSIVACFSVFITRFYNPWIKLENRKSYPIILLVLGLWCLTLIYKIIEQDLIVFYLSLLSLIASFYIVLRKYVEK